MAMNRFDADEDAPYATCATCDEKLSAKADARTHLDATLGQSSGRSHRIRITNPTRAERIEHEIERLVADATDAFVSDLQQLVDERSITPEEATTGVAQWSEFADAWKEAA